jgi:hypothetical protein
LNGVANAGQCDGARPECSCCKKRGDGCVYDFDVGADTTRYQALRRKHADLEQRFGQTVEVLELLQKRPRPEAQAIFEQIRRGSTLNELLQQVREGDMLIGLASPMSIQQNEVPPHTDDGRRRLHTLAPLQRSTSSTAEVLPT